MRSIWVLLIGLVLAGAPRWASAQASPPPAGGSSGYDSLGADWGAQQDEARAGVRQGRFLPLSRVIQEIRRRHPGHQLDAGLEQWGGRPAYRVRWAGEHGQRIDYIVDAATGAILSAQGR
jgi:uncharacterized membrane protein YkoI